MIKLYEKIKKYRLEDAIDFEKNDRQFLALEKLWWEILKNPSNSLYKKEDLICFYLSLIIANSIVCYQLSGKWENYWEEFSEESIKFINNNSLKLGNSKKNIDLVYSFLIDFLRICKNNKRFTETKIKRLHKLRWFLDDFSWKWEYFYENMLELRDLLAKTMNQKKNAKTIVFAVKMFSYGARNIFWFREFPKEISIPIDSRLTNLFEKYKSFETEKIEDFYSDLAKKLNIPEMHLDGIIWNLYDELIK